MDRSNMTFANTFDYSTSQKLISQLKENNIRFKIEEDSSAIKEMDTLLANKGGTYGDGAQLLFFIHSEDMFSYTTICESIIGSQIEEEIPIKNTTKKNKWFKNFFS